MTFIVVREGLETIHFDGDGYVYSGGYETRTYIVDLERVPSFARSHEIEFNGVSAIIEKALAGQTTHETTRAYSFSNFPESYSPILVEKMPEGAITLEIDVEVY